jgi:hypothetical protein
VCSFHIDIIVNFERVLGAEHRLLETQLMKSAKLASSLFSPTSRFQSVGARVVYQVPAFPGHSVFSQTPVQSLASATESDDSNQDPDLEGFAAKGLRTANSELF